MRLSLAPASAPAARQPFTSVSVADSKNSWVFHSAHGPARSAASA